MQLKRPTLVNPVQDPKRRDHSLGGNSDDGNETRSIQHSNGGANPFMVSHGYVSGGLQTDTESARLSNVQPYKFNSNQNKLNPNGINIRKINPNQIQLKPMSRGSGVGAGLNAKPGLDLRSVHQTLQPGSSNGPLDKPSILQDPLGANSSILSGASTGVNTNVLPDLKKLASRSQNREAATSNLLEGSAHKLRKASPEALALLMANKKKSDAALAGGN